MSEKRTITIAIKVSAEMKEEIQKIADRQRWTLSSTVYYIVEQFLKDKTTIRL